MPPAIRVIEHAFEIRPWHLQDSLSSLRTDQTTIIVAHRLSTVMDADIIIVMQVAHAACHSPDLLTQA